ncbi:hypothetical protein DFH09DRAFT_947301, partial [Mycena vulgaris]
NRTIDDFKGDEIAGFLPIYEPQNLWNIGSSLPAKEIDREVIAVAVVYSPTRAKLSWHDTTWHNGDSPSTVTIKFTGTAIYLFCIVPNTVPFSDTVIDLSFTLDGSPQDHYTHTPDASSGILYSVPVLAAGQLSNEPHTLVARTAIPSLFIFDYVMYTWVQFNSSDSQSILLRYSRIQVRRCTFAGDDD